MAAENALCAARLAFDQISATAPEIDGAEQALRDLNQPLLFHIDEGQSELDKALAQRGYHLVDPPTYWPNRWPIYATKRFPKPPYSRFGPL